MDKPRLAWAITGSGHNLEQCLDFLMTLEYVDLYLSDAGEQVLKAYDININVLRDIMPVYHDTAASTLPLGPFYKGHYHTFVIAPASSNTVAKCVLGISDSLVSNLYSQAGKSRIPSIVYSSDNAPEIKTRAPDREVTVYPRMVALEATEKLRSFEDTDVVDSIEELIVKVKARLDSLT